MQKISPAHFEVEGAALSSLPKPHPGVCYHVSRRGERTQCVGRNVGSAECIALHRAGHACSGSNRKDGQHVVHVRRKA